MKNTNSVSSFNHLNDAYASDKKNTQHYKYWCQLKGGRVEYTIECIDSFISNL